MTGLMNDMLRHRAESLERPELDVERMLLEGDKRVRRRRTALVGGIAALSVTAALAGPPLLGVVMPDRTQSQQAGFAGTPDTDTFALQPSWSVGSVIHLGDGSTVDVGRPVLRFQLTAGGAVFRDDQFGVWSVVGGDVTQVGKLAPNGGVITDRDGRGTKAAWVEHQKGDQPVYAVLDQSTGEVVRESLGNPAGMRDPSETGAFVDALDGDTLYATTDQGLVAWNTETDDVTVVAPKGENLPVLDVQNGTILTYTNDGSGCAQVGTQLEGATTLGEPCIEYAELLSPDGKYVTGSTASGDHRVYDTSTGQEMPADTHGFEIFDAVQWLDNERFVARGFETPALLATLDDGSQMLDPREPTDLFTCSAISGECTVLAEDIDASTDEWVQLPGFGGEPLNSLPEVEQQLLQKFLDHLE